MKNKKRVLSGIRATGELHLGNYLGAVRGMVELQEDPGYETFYMVADAHAITTPYDKESLRKKTRDVVLDYLAAGVDPEKSAIFIQSQVPQHFELEHYLSSVITVNRLQHLPTFKEKIKEQSEEASMALLNYPVLMAADILAYKAHEVPVGDDQEPHLEISRLIARKMNAKYGTDFPEPRTFKTDGSYIPGLTGEGKMSKSVEGSYINLTDDLETIKDRLAKVPTDSGRGEKVPGEGGVAVLLYFVEMFQGKDMREKYEKDYMGEGIRYADLKESLAEAIYEELKPIQEKRKEAEKIVDDVIEQGRKKAQEIAEQTLAEVREKMGF
jgi:tryptophanyl-tRNA synthetase